jgi:hypothetical protein
MKTESLNSVMVDVLKNNRQVGKSLVEAYRTGGTKLVEKSLSGRFGARGLKVGEFLIKGIGKASDTAEDAMGMMCNRACGVLVKIDDNKYAAKYLGLVSKVTLPSAKIVRNLSGKLAQRVGKGPRSAATSTRRKRVKHRPMHRKAAAA